MALTKIVKTVPGTDAPTAADRINACFDAVDRLNAAWVNPEEFGAVGNGSTDDTSAFASALATKRELRLITGKKYVIGDLAVPDGSRIIGDGGLGYAGDTKDTVSDKPIIIAKSGCSSVFNIDLKRSGYFKGFMMDGIDRLSRAFSGGGQLMYLHTLTVNRFLSCFGGFGAGDNTYSRTNQIENCQFSDSTTGIDNIIDTNVRFGAVSACGTGVHLITGANSNKFTNLRVEFCTGHGWDIYQADSNIVIGGMTDRCGKAGFRATDMRGVLILQGHHGRRNGSNDAATDSRVNFYFDSNSDSSSSIQIIGCTSQTGPDDGGGGTVTPRYSIGFNGTNKGITVIGGDYRAGTTGAIIGTTTGGGNDIRFIGARGLTDQ